MHITKKNFLSDNQGIFIYFFCKLFLQNQQKKLNLCIPINSFPQQTSESIASLSISEISNANLPKSHVYLLTKKIISK